MNIGKKFFAAATATLALTGATVAGATLAVAPAQAATISAGSELRVDPLPQGTVRFRQDSATNFTLDFRLSPATTIPGIPPFIPPIIIAEVNGNPTNVSVTSGTGSFENSALASLIPPLPRIRDIGLVATSNSNIFTLASPIANFLTGVDIPTGLFSRDPVSFDLASFTFNRALGRATFGGTFFSNGFSIAGSGEFETIRNLGSSFQNYSFRFQAIPTPALLPGLIGMGIAAVRKRKSEQEAAASEAVEVEA